VHGHGHGREQLRAEKVKQRAECVCRGPGAHDVVKLRDEADGLGGARQPSAQQPGQEGEAEGEDCFAVDESRAAVGAAVRQPAPPPA